MEMLTTCDSTLCLVWHDHAEMKVTKENLEQASQWENGWHTVLAEIYVMTKLIIWIHSLVVTECEPFWTLSGGIYWIWKGQSCLWVMVTDYRNIHFFKCMMQSKFWFSCDFCWWCNWSHLFAGLVWERWRQELVAEIKTKWFFPLFPNYKST